MSVGSAFPNNILQAVFIATGNVTDTCCTLKLFGAILFPAFHYNECFATCCKPKFVIMEMMDKGLAQNKIH